MIYLILVILVILDGIVDALFFTGEKFLSKNIEITYKIILFCLPMLYAKKLNWRYIINVGLIYWFIHIALFDLSFNIFSGLSLNYVGTTSGFYDQIMFNLVNWQFWVLRVFFLFLSIVLYAKTLKK